MYKIRIELNGCEVESATLTGFMAVSDATPDDYKGAEVKDGELTMMFESEPSVGAFQEVLRVLGGSAKGDNPMRVISPDRFKDATAVPHEHKGARRWECPRCNVSVMEGHNDTKGALYGVCQRCNAVDTGRDPDALPPAPAETRPRAPSPTVAAPRPSSAPTKTPPAAAAAVPQGFLQVPTIPHAGLLPYPPPRAGLFCVLEQTGGLAWSTSTGWHVTDGRVPTREL